MSAHAAIELIARGLIECEGNVLFCTNLKKGYHYLPGGHIEHGEAAGEALAREIREECGLKSRVGRLLAVAEVGFGSGKKATHELNLVFHVELPGVRGHGNIESNERHIGFTWLPKRSLSRFDVRPAVLRKWVGTMNRKSPAPVFLSDFAIKG